MTATLELEGQGELLWDLGAKHLFAYHFEADTHLTLAQDLSVDADGEILPVEASLEFEGKFRMDVSVE